MQRETCKHKVNAHIFETAIVGDGSYCSTPSLEKQGHEVREDENDNQPFGAYTGMISAEYRDDAREAYVNGCAEEGGAYGEGYEIPGFELVAGDARRGGELT